MPFRGFNQVEAVARFVAGLDFAIIGTSQGDFTPEHTKYACTITASGKDFNTSYQSNPSVYGEPNLIDVLTSLAGDARLANDYEIDEFADELGFSKPSEAIRAYEGCKRTLEWMRDTLDLNAEDIAQLAETLDEHADEVGEELRTLLSKRTAEYERTHPKVPEGFVSVESLQEDLDLGEYGDQLTEYCGDITDAIQDCADNNVDLFTADLLHWLPDNYEWFEEAAAQGLFTFKSREDIDLARMIQMAQYECFSQDMYDHQEDICKNYVLEQLKDAGVYAVSGEVADALDTEIDYKGADSFDALVDEAKEQIQQVMTANLEGVLDGEEYAQEAVKTLVDGDVWEVINPCALSAEAVCAVNEKGYDAAFNECAFWKDKEHFADDEPVSLACAANECRLSASGLDKSEVRAEMAHER